MLGLVHSNIKELHGRIKAGDYRSLARGITLLENELSGYEALLDMLDNSIRVPVIGITGPPGAGKSTLVNALLQDWLTQGKRIAVVAVDPSSPFNFGALLGDRIRMADFYANPNVYIRSLASRGALGGLSKKIVDITALIRQATFDLVLVETVGVGQSEVEIAGLADVTVVALVPEAGDEIQTLKAGIMEIADIFVVNKADRENAEALYRNLRIMVHEKASDHDEVPVFKTVATAHQGITELAVAILNLAASISGTTERQVQLLAEQSWQIIQAKQMSCIHFFELKEALKRELSDKEFNLYRFSAGYLRSVLQRQ